MRFSNALALLAAMSLAACATQPENIEAAYVSPTKYAGLTCAQLNAERSRLVGQVKELTGQQKEKATNDAVAMGVGLGSQKGCFKARP